MEVTSPTWDAKESAYTFHLTVATGSESNYLVKGDAIFVDNDYDLSSTLLPVIPDAVLNIVISRFIEETKHWFTTPLSNESMKKRLRHTASKVEKPSETGWYQPIWMPFTMKASRSSFELCWKLTQWLPSTPKISAEFCTGLATPRAQSPEQPANEGLRTIQIQDTLIPVGDLPLSDLPPLAFYTEPEGDLHRQQIRQKIREARLRVALAKLKAERMEQKYYDRYGEVPENSEDSSELSSESDSADEPFGTQAHS